ncbi:MAG: hypothetical protein JSS72_10970 [Armatimonadetes bacterium]|nr:hypothetical protein [Armatimonadota bacterium]
MYLVVSRWEPLPGKEKEFEAQGLAARDAIRNTPGVETVMGFTTEDGARIAIIGYKSKSVYEEIMGDNGAFAKIAAKHQIENVAKWVRSERGEMVD